MNKKLYDKGILNLYMLVFDEFINTQKFSKEKYSNILLQAKLTEEIYQTDYEYVMSLPVITKDEQEEAFKQLKIALLIHKISIASEYINKIDYSHKNYIKAMERYDLYTSEYLELSK